VLGYAVGAGTTTDRPGHAPRP